MAADTYNSFAELTRHEALNKDYSISISDVGSSITIIALHGGKIEPHTSELAKLIANNNYNCYCFEGIKKINNGALHITSHKFDEPAALNIISKSSTVLAIHACTGTHGVVYLGGLDKPLIKAIATELKARSIGVLLENSRFKGSNPHNICNRGATGKGVQLEITRDLRDNWKKLDLISEAVQAALNKA